MDKSKIANMRKSYEQQELLENNILDNPMDQFQKWFDDALNSEVKEANAMVLATVKAGKPSARVLLLKGFDMKGFVFFTNYNSHKAQEINENPFASMVFFWDACERQVRIEGVLEKVTDQASDEYFHSRPTGSQIGAWVSNQSETIESRTVLDDNLAYFSEKFKDTNPIPRPSHWGGYVLKPSSIEFWQGRANRLHDRILYTLVGDNWQIERLSP